MSEKLNAALAAMDELEAGAIANPSEGRRVSSQSGKYSENSKGYNRNK